MNGPMWKARALELGSLLAGSLLLLWADWRVFLGVFLLLLAEVPDWYGDRA